MELLVASVVRLYFIDTRNLILFTYVYVYLQVQWKIIVQLELHAQRSYDKM